MNINIPQICLILLQIPGNLVLTHSPKYGFYKRVDLILDNIFGKC